LFEVKSDLLTNYVNSNITTNVLLKVVKIFSSYLSSSSIYKQLT